MTFLTKILLVSFFALTCAGAPLHAATVRELYDQAVDAYNRQDYDHAITFYQEITKITPHFAPAYVGIGLALKSKGADIDEVVYYYKTATDMDPTNAQAFQQLGRLYYSLNKYDQAEKSFLRCLKIDPSTLDAKLSLGWIYLLGKSKPELAVKYFKDVYKQSKDPNAYFGLGMAYFATNDRVDAIDIITDLRNNGQEDFAKRLEQMVRENRKVNVNQEAAQPQDMSALSAPATDTGVKVRLRGRLSDLN